MLLEELVSIGFKKKEAQKLAESKYFHHKRKNSRELTNLFNGISEVYECGFEQVKKAVLAHPGFAGYDHERVVRQGKEAYGEENEERIKKAILAQPQFVNYDHERVIRQGKEVYGEENEERIKKAVLANPPFAGYDHERVVRQGKEAYGEENEERIKKAILAQPPFGNYDHERVIRQKTRLGRMVGLSQDEVINLLLDKPALAGCRVARYLAAFDVARKLENEGFSQNENMLKAFFSYYSKSPYVPDFKEKRISQVQRKGITDYKEPPLMQSMRKRLSKYS